MKIRDALKKSLREYAEPSRAIPTGFVELDSLIGGFVPGLTVIGGRPGGGKTSLLCMLALYAATSNPPCSIVVFSREQTIAETVLYNIIPMSLGASSKMIRDQQFSVSDLETEIESSGLPHLPIDIIDQHECPDYRMTAKYIRDYAEREKPNIMFIDYLQILDSDTDSQNREREVANLVDELNSISKINRIPIVLLAQMNRDADQRKEKPKKHDDDWVDETIMPENRMLRESAVIEHTAKTIILLWTRGEKAKNESVKFVTGIISKCRNGQSHSNNELGVAHVHFAFDGDKKRFLERSRAEEHYADLVDRLKQFEPF